MEIDRPRECYLLDPNEQRASGYPTEVSLENRNFLFDICRRKDVLLDANPSAYHFSGGALASERFRINFHIILLSGMIEVAGQEMSTSAAVQEIEDFANGGARG